MYTMVDLFLQEWISQSSLRCHEKFIWSQTYQQ